MKLNSIILLSLACFVCFVTSSDEQQNHQDEQHHHQNQTHHRNHHHRHPHHLHKHSHAPSTDHTKPANDDTLDEVKPEYARLNPVGIRDQNVNCLKDSFNIQMNSVLTNVDYKLVLNIAYKASIRPNIINQIEDPNLYIRQCLHTVYISARTDPEIPEFTYVHSREVKPGDDYNALIDMIGPLAPLKKYVIKFGK
jgi:hypothetical protein